MRWEGTFKNNQILEGICHFPDGRVYEGEWLAEQFHGHGSFSAPDGTLIYNGDWIEGQRSGEGTLFNTDGKIHYEGSWKQNLPDGHGCFFGPDEKPIY